MYLSCFDVLFFFLNDTATTEIYTLSLHDALPISLRHAPPAIQLGALVVCGFGVPRIDHRSSIIDHRSSIIDQDRKSTRLNSSHRCISYAVFCLKKKKKNELK